MKDFKKGLTSEAVAKVTTDMSARAVKSGSLDVLATPALIALMEHASCNCAAYLLDENETTVGTRISISHDKASAIGETIRATAVLESVNARRLTFSVCAYDSKNDIIGKGTIERFLVISDKFMKRVQDL